MAIRDHNADVTKNPAQECLACNGAGCKECEKAPPGGPTGLLRRWGPVGALIFFAGGKLKWLLSIFKFAKFGTLATMVLSIAVYARFFGWPFAVGFVLLIFVHELGHAIAMRQQGIPGGAPVFIPFLGAFIAMRGKPKNAWVEAVVGIGGPLLGTAGAMAVLVAAFATGYPLLFALASTGFLINLFNMIPISPLDGGRIVGVFGRWLWALGYIICGGLILLTWSPVLIFILLIGLLNLRRILNPPPGYNEVPNKLRAVMALGYFGGACIMAMGMMVAQQFLGHLMPVEAFALHGGALLAGLGLEVSGTRETQTESEHSTPIQGSVA
jgi:Zn-dependent protease